MTLAPDFKEFISSLKKNRVKYLIVGGYAVVAHGYDRLTKDLDIWLWMNEANAGQTLLALQDFGFESIPLQVEDFMQPNTFIQLGYPPLRIDLMTELAGLSFETCYPKRMSLTIDDITVDFIDKESLKKNKKASGRPQDLADLDNL